MRARVMDRPHRPVQAFDRYCGGGRRVVSTRRVGTGRSSHREAAAWRRSCGASSAPFVGSRPRVWHIGTWRPPSDAARGAPARGPPARYSLRTFDPSTSARRVHVAFDRGHRASRTGRSGIRPRLGSSTLRAPAAASPPGWPCCGGRRALVSTTRSREPHRPALSPRCRSTAARDSPEPADAGQRYAAAGCVLAARRGRRRRRSTRRPWAATTRSRSRPGLLVAGPSPRDRGPSSLGRCVGWRRPAFGQLARRASGLPRRRRNCEAAARVPAATCSGLARPPAACMSTHSCGAHQPPRHQAPPHGGQTRRAWSPERRARHLLGERRARRSSVGRRTAGQ